MRPIPENASKIFELTFYEGKIKEAYQLFDQISDPLDKILSRIIISLFDFVLGERERIKKHIGQLEIILNGSSDYFVNLLTQYSYHLSKGCLNIGFVIPIENYKEGKKNFEKSFQIFENNFETFQSNDWIYQFFLILTDFMRTMVPNSVQDKVDMLNKVINHTKSFSHDGTQLRWYFCMVLGFVYTNLGLFKEAHKMFTVEPVQTNYIISTFALQELARLSYIEGNISEAINLAKKGLDIDLKINFNWGISLLKTALAFYFAENGENDKAKSYLIELIPIKKAIANPFSTILGYYNLIRFLTNNYQILSNLSLIDEAKYYLVEAQNYSKPFIENPNVVNYLKISEAILLKLGRFRDKAQAYSIFQEMANYYSRNQISIHLKLDLVELLIEEAKTCASNSGMLDEIITELDDLIDQIAKRSILYTPNGAILKYIQRQILVSRYYFYIKGQSREAIDILNSGLQQVEKYNLPELKRKLKLEIEKMSKQILLYANQTIQERLNQIEIENYFKQAMQLQEMTEIKKSDINS